MQLQLHLNQTQALLDDDGLENCIGNGCCCRQIAGLQQKKQWSSGQEKFEGAVASEPQQTLFLP